MVPFGRRRFLGRVGATVAGVVGLVGTTSASADSDAFDPTRHAFGFPNWAASDAMFEEHDDVNVDANSVEAILAETWPGTFAEFFGMKFTDVPQSVLALISRQISVAANQMSAANGHCYGMTYSAQRYFETPRDLPAGVESAADVTNPEIPLGSDEGPIGDLIDYYQRSQLLNVYAWAGRRRMYRPETIDYEAELAALIAVIDEFGTAGLTLVDIANHVSHQVLIYDYTKTAEGTKLAVYDPNYPAPQYREKQRTFLVRPTEATPISNYGPYGAFVFNRWDRAIRAGVDNAMPNDSDSHQQFGYLLSRVVRVTVDSPAVSLAVVDPDGNPVERNTAEYMDRGQAAVWATRYRYDAPAGDYRIAIVGKSPVEYRLDAEVAGLDSDVLTQARSVSVSPGEVHEYTLRVPEDGSPSLSRDGSGLLGSVTSLDPTSLAVGVASGAALAYLQARR
ncbi:hypothetical protein ACFQJC_04165 [Haloferax namakaokahaiae]|uniref:Uncharacterized protein n=1 Tax=Haloferax namakaokahaiae TaxID=1748331 RepID=A0ABD5ZBY3_9EURY